LVLAFVTLIAAFSLIELRTERNESIFMILAVGTFVFQFPLLFQYSTRIWFRVIWLLLLLTCAHLSIAILGKPKSERRTS
jgi:Ca2+/Na+ antiporter